MSTERLYGITLVGLQKEKAKVLDFLHSNGIVHIKPKEDIDNMHELDVDVPLAESEKIAASLLELKWMTEHLRPFVSKKNIEPSFPNRDLKEPIRESSILHKKIYAKLSKAVNGINACNEVIESSHNKIETLKRIPFNIDKKNCRIIDTESEYVNGSKTAKKVRVNLAQEVISCGSLIFTVLAEEPPREKGEHIVPIRDVLKGFNDSVSAIRKGHYSIIQGLAKDKEKVELQLKDQGYAIYPVPMVDVDKDTDIVNAKAKASKALKEKHAFEREIKKLAKGYYVQAAKLLNELTIYHERYYATHQMYKTSKTFMMEGFVSLKDYKVLNKIGNVANVHMDVKRAKEGPTKLRNNPYTEKFEFITKMFGFPSYGSVDPTIFVSLFLPFFFGFMFSDIGYGIMLLGLSLVMLSKATPYMKILKDGGFVMLVCSLSTIIFGWFFGSFFGTLIKVTPLLFDPFQEAKLVLVAGLGLGLIHINLGIFIGMYEAIRDRDLKGLILNYVSILALEGSFACFALGMKNYGLAYLALALLLFFLKSSIMGLLEVTGFVGTWFSYARLLALSLATGGIALGINIMAQQLSNVKFLGPILFILLVLVGHLFNFAMNVLGSSIHSVRLHYIEFFAQFYEAGGKPFKAFTTKKVKDTI